MLILASFCENAAPIMALIGTAVNIFKIIIPVLIILFGTIDLGKAVIASDDKAIKTATGVLIKRIIAGIVIFFIPVLVRTVFNLFADGENAMTNAQFCIQCATGGDCTVNNTGNTGN